VQPVPLDPFGLGPSDDRPNVDVGAFEQGSPASRWALARYLVGRAVLESVSRSLFVVALLVLALAVVVQVTVHWTFFAVLIGIVGFGVLGFRALLRAVLSRLMAAGQVAPLEQRLRALVADTRSDVRRELRRIGLPSHTWTLPLFAFRLLSRKRRPDTVARLRTFDVDNVVPRTRIDELHLLLRNAVGRPGPAA
jgi:hypothetical protein